MVYTAYKVYEAKRFIKFDLGRTKEASNMASITTSQRGLQNGWTRNTFILRKEYLEKLKALAYWERKTIKDVVDEALGSYLKSKVTKKGGKRDEEDDRGVDWFAFSDGHGLRRSKWQEIRSGLQRLRK
jgi:hypothetical protein